MKKTDINKALEQNPNTVFRAKYGYIIIERVRVDNRGITRAFGRHINCHYDTQTGESPVRISERTDNFTLTQIDRVVAPNLEAFQQMVIEQHHRDKQAREKRAQQAELQKQAEADMQVILNRVGINWHGAHFTTHYNGKCTLEMAPAALALLVAYINEHTQEVTA